MTLKHFRENIWWQLAVLLVLALVCGVILGTVWYLSNLKNRDTFDYSLYKSTYGQTYTYKADKNFKGSLETVNTSKNGIIDVTTLEKVEASDGAVLVKVDAHSTDSTKVNLVMIIAVKEDTATEVYFLEKGKTWLENRGYPVDENGKMNVADFVLISGATQTFDGVSKAIEMAVNAASVDTFNYAIYKTIYGESKTYKVQKGFTQITGSANNGTVKAVEKVNVEGENTAIIKVEARGMSHVYLDMYVVVTDKEADFIYFTETANTYLSGYYNVVNNKLSVIDLVKTSGATETYNTLIEAIRVAKEA